MTKLEALEEMRAFSAGMIEKLQLIVEDADDILDAFAHEIEAAQSSVHSLGNSYAVENEYAAEHKREIDDAVDEFQLLSERMRVQAERLNRAMGVGFKPSRGPR